MAGKSALGRVQPTLSSARLTLDYAERSSAKDTVATESDSTRGSAPVVLERGVAIGRYVVLSRIGAGGMGIVYAAYDPELDRRVALKLLRTDAPGGARSEASRRLQREAQALARLNHPNVVAVHDVLEHEGRIVLAMEFVDGVTLGAWRRARARSWREILDVFVAAARGLIAAHDRGLVHRDFKPDNVMITSSGMAGDHRVRVMDFGLARPSVDTPDPDARRDDAPIDVRRSPSALDSQLTHVDVVVGTPAYMAPEQLAGRDVGPAADQFSFCVALWESLYGERPFRGEGLPDLARAIVEGERSAPPSDAAVPRWLHRACERGMSTDPAHRFADMHALVATLQGGHRRKRSRVAAIGLAASATIGVGLAVDGQHARTQADAACERDGAAIAEIWNDSTRAAVRVGLLQSGAIAGETTFQKVTPWLDEHARAWQSARTEACRTHALAGQWDHDMLDRAASCLEERKLELQALVTTLAAADSEAANRAVTAAAGLAPIEPCLDDATLQRRSSSPTETRAEILEIHAELARVDALAVTGAHTAGIELARASLERAEALGWPRLIAGARRRLGWALMATGAYAEGESIMEAAYFEAVGAGEIDEALTAADVLTEHVGTTLARPDDGLRWSKHAAVLRAMLPDPVGLREAWGLAAIARIELTRGNYEQAQIGYEAVLERLEDAFGPDHPKVANSLEALGIARFRRGDYGQARADFERALAIVVTTKGPEHPDVVPSLNNLGLVEIKTGAYAEAKAHYERALALQTAASGPTHPDVATIVANLGMVVHLLGDFDESSKLHARALALREAALGPDHAAVGDSVNNLGLDHFKMGRYDEAERSYERARAIKTKAFGDDHPAVAETLFNLADIARRRGDPDAAEANFVRALAILEPALGPGHPDLALPLLGLARVAIDRGQGPQAVAFAERALALRERDDVPTELRAEARLVLARALTVGGTPSSRAGMLAEQACTTLRRGGAVTRFYAAECDVFEDESAGQRDD